MDSDLHTLEQRLTDLEIKASFAEDTVQRPVSARGAISAKGEKQ